jgi:uncharacterized membrane protein YwzB
MGAQVCIVILIGFVAVFWELQSINSGIKELIKHRTTSKSNH